MKMIFPNDDIVPQVLSWLPGKSLMRFKSVSKKWFSIITDSLFVKSRVSRFHCRSRSHGDLVIIPRGYRGNNNQGKNSNPRIFVIELEKHRVTFHDPSPTFVYNGITNIVDGLICFYLANYDEITFMCLYNITTRESLRLPCPPRKSSVLSRSITLCYNPIHNEYKLLHMHWRTKDSFNSEILTIFGRNDRNTWRSVDELPPMIGRGLFVRGVRDNYGYYHDGLIHPCRCAISGDLTVFNVACEKFETIEFPEKYDESYKITTCDVGGCLSVVVHEHPCRVELWRLIGRNDDGKLSWTREAIKSMSLKVKCSDFGLLSLETFKNEFKSNLLSIQCYDLRTREHKVVKVTNDQCFFGTSM